MEKSLNVGKVKNSDFKELSDELSLKDGEPSVTMEVTDLGITVNCFLVTLIP